MSEILSSVIEIPSLPKRDGYGERTIHGIKVKVLPKCLFQTGKSEHIFVSDSEMRRLDLCPSNAYQITLGSDENRFEVEFISYPKYLQLNFPSSEREDGEVEQSKLNHYQKSRNALRFFRFALNNDGLQLMSDKEGQGLLLLMERSHVNPERDAKKTLRPRPALKDRTKHNDKRWTRRFIEQRFMDAKKRRTPLKYRI